MDEEAGRPGRATMADVGRLANVSAMTVSRTLAGHPVSPAIRRRVLVAVEQLDYVPDASAGALSSGRSAFVAALVPTLNNSNFADTARGLTDALAGTGLELPLGYTEYSTEREATLVRAMLRRRPAAIVLTGGDHANDTRQALSRATLPVVETWDAPERPLGHVVGFSNASAAELRVRHLVGRGYRRIAFLGGRSGAGPTASAASPGRPQPSAWGRRVLYCPLRDTATLDGARSEGGPENARSLAGYAGRVLRQRHVRVR